MLWVPVTLCAVVLQILRTSWQKQLSHELDIYLATWARYLFALPLVPLILGYIYYYNNQLLSFSVPFIFFCILGGSMQIIATLMLLKLFSFRNFATSTAFAKTEGIQIAIFGIIFLNETISLLGTIAIIIGSVSIIALSSPSIKNSYNKTAVFYGLGCGFFFALTAWSIRLSYRYVDINIPLFSAAFTLSTMICIQTLILTIYIIVWRDGGVNFHKIWGARHIANKIGISSALGSLCWFWGFALTNPAYVKTLAQLELPIAMVIGFVTFSEKQSKVEIIAMIGIIAAAICVTFA